MSTVPGETRVEEQAVDLGQEAGLSSLVHSLLAVWREIALSRLSLFALEIKRATLSFSGIDGMAVAIGLLLASTWLIFLALTLYWAIEGGMSWNVAGAIMLAANLVAAGSLILAIRNASEKLTFTATRQSLQDN